MIKLWTAIKILAEQFGIKLSIVELLPTLLKSRVAWCVVVALVVQFNGCKAARDSWYEGYSKGCKECGNGQVEPSPDDSGWYPFKHMRRFIFGTGNLQSPPTEEDWQPPEIIDHPPVTEGETLEAPR